MKLDLTDLLYALSFALDRVEEELLGIDTGHGKRVAYLALLMGKEAGLGVEELRDFIGCCLLHDNALTEFIHEELSHSPMLHGMPAHLSELAEGQKPVLDHEHCVVGEENIRLLPFHTDIRHVILYHHENADGTGPLGITAAGTPQKAQILHLADMADTTFQFHLQTMTEKEFNELSEWVQGQRGQLFSDEVVALFSRAVRYDRIMSMQRIGLHECLREALHQEVADYSDEEIRNIAGLFAKIVDYKSEFTQEHSRGVAEKAEIMARYYGFDPEKTIRFYFAGAMHDIGKLAIINDILEKPDKLTVNEYEKMKNHAGATQYILSQIKEIPDVVRWASNHHERLDGSGYPQGLSAGDLSFEDQLMACIDIYQALTEKRPYKDGVPHDQTIAIMRSMAEKGGLNEQVIRDLDIVMGARC